jgi:hypothetical protein
MAPVNPLPIMPDVWQVVWNWSATGGQIANNVYYVQSASTSAATVFATLEGAQTVAMLGLQSEGAVVSTVTLTRLDGSSPSTDFAATGPQWAGTSPADWIPQASAVITKTPSVRGRGRKGRFFLPFVSEAVTTNGSLITAAVTPTQAAWSAYLGALAGATTPMLVIGVGDAQRVPPRPPFRSQVTALTLHAALGTQRKRQQRLYS